MVFRTFLLQTMVFITLTCIGLGCQEEETVDIDEGAADRQYPDGTQLEVCFTTSEMSLQTAATMARLSSIVYRDEPDARQEILADENLNIGLDQLEFYDAGETQALLARHQSLPVLVIVFRGTHSVTDWLYNLDAGQVDFARTMTWSDPWGDVHSGFTRALDNVYADIVNDLKSINDEGLAVYITGHSLGGALATLMTARLLHDQEELGIHHLGGLYTFGSPRVGNEDFRVSMMDTADSVGMPIVRFRNHLDIVTRVPFRVTEDTNQFVDFLVDQYAHVGNLGHFNRVGDFEFGATTRWVPSMDEMEAMEQFVINIIEDEEFRDDPDTNADLSELIDDHNIDAYHELILSLQPDQRWADRFTCN